MLNGFGMNLFGWQPDFVHDAVREQLDAGYEIGPQHPLAGEVAQLVCELTGFDRAGLCNTGSEAVMGAMRIARTVTGRSTIVIFTGAYHGIFDEVIVRAGRKRQGQCRRRPASCPAVRRRAACSTTARPSRCEIHPRPRRRPGRRPGRAGAEPPPRLPAARVPAASCARSPQKSGTLLIFDEVITGFRSHPGGAQALFGIRADLATYGKVVGGGFPIGVIAGKREYMDALDGGGWQYGDDSMPTVGVTYFAGTFVRHPLALAAAQGRRWRT